jgi:hypothetical protein
MTFIEQPEEGGNATRERSGKIPRVTSDKKRKDFNAKRGSVVRSDDVQKA